MKMIWLDVPLSKIILDTEICNDETCPSDLVWGESSKCSATLQCDVDATRDMNRREEQTEQGKAVYISSSHWMKALMCPLL